MKKRILAVVLAFLMVVGMLPTNVYTSYAEEVVAESTESTETNVWDVVGELSEVCLIGFLDKSNENIIFYNNGTAREEKEIAAAECPDYLILKQSYTHLESGEAVIYQVDSADDEFYFGALSQNPFVEAKYFSTVVEAEELYATLVSDGEITLYKDLTSATDTTFVAASELTGEYVVADFCYDASLYGWFIKLTADENWPENAEGYAWVNCAQVAGLSQTATQIPEEPEKCPVCGKEDCTTEHVKCEGCGEYDCVKIHFYCELCKKHDCGQAHIFCTVCKEYDCGKTHYYCSSCGEYDCGEEHEDEYKPDTAPVIPDTPTLTDGADVSLVDEYGDSITDSFVLYEGMKSSLSAWTELEGEVSYQWQVCYNNSQMLWVDIYGQTGKGILVSPAMFLSIIDYQAVTYLRCVVTNGSETQVSEPISIVVDEMIPQQSVAMFSARSGDSGEENQTQATNEGTSFSIKIYFEFEDGEEAATPYVASLSEGQNWILDVPCPAIAGYAPYYLGVITERITDTITDIQGDVTYTVTYLPDYVDFKVNHYWQEIATNEYTIHEVETISGFKTEMQVGEGLKKTYEGFDALDYDTEITVAADGSTEVNIYYDRGYFIVALDLNGGYGAEPIYARYGTPVKSIISTPQRTGYTFTAWDPALPDEVPAYNSSYTAQWTKAATNFVVAFWYENANDENYTFVGSVQQTATTDSKVNGADYKNADFGDNRDDEHFTYEKADTDVEIVADGSSVVNVYFSRNTYKLTYMEFVCPHVKYSQHTSACCSLTAHTHPNAACCTITEHTQHVIDCISNRGNKVTNSGNVSELNANTPNATNGSWGYFEVKLGNWVLDTYYCVYWGGTWYHLSGTDTQIEWNCSGLHTHGTSSCNSNKCSVGYTHTHGSGCNTSNCAHKNWNYDGADGYFWCPCIQRDSEGRYVADDPIRTNPANWVICEDKDGNDAQYTVKYQQDVSAIHASMPAYRWGPGPGSGLPASEGPYGSGAAVGTFSSMNGCDVTFYRSSYGSVKYTFYFLLETADGKPTSISIEYNGKHFEKSSIPFTPAMGAVGYKGDYQAGRPFGFDDFEAWAVDDNGTHLKQLPSPNGSFGGSTYTKYYFYYKRTEHTLTYFNGSTKLATRTMKFEEPLTETYNLQNLTMTSPYGSGYYFEGWYMDADCVVKAKFDGSEKMSQGGMALYAKWAPVQHTVRTYLTKDDVGTVSKALHTYQVLHGNVYSGSVETPINSSLTFVSWFYEEDGVEKAYNFSLPVYKDMDLYAKWTSDTMVTGWVYYKDTNGNTIGEPSQIRGTVGATKTYAAKIGTELNDGYTSGYYPNEVSHNVLFSANENQNTYTFVYTEMEEVSYTIFFIDKDTGDAVSAPISGTTKGAKIEVNLQELEGYSPKANYVADANKKTFVLSSDETLNKFYFYYTYDEENATVQIEHYIQNTSGSGYSHYYTEPTTKVEIGTIVTAEDIAITGFTYNAEASYNGQELTSDGLILKLYYDRNSYSYTFHFVYKNEKGEDVEFADSAVTGMGLYGVTVSQAAKSFPGYKLTSAGSQTITIGTETSSNERTFYYEEDTVTIYYQVGAVKGGAVEPDSESIKAVSESASGSSATVSSTDYVFTGWYTDYACTEADRVSTDAAFKPEQVDGVWVADYYYAGFEEAKVTIHYLVEMPEGATEESTLTKTSEQVSTLSGKAVGSAVDTIPDGYAFAGWYDADGNELSTSENFIPTRPNEKWVDETTYIAKFIEKKATISYAAVGHGIISPATEEVDMMTGEAVGATATPTENISTFVGWYDNEDCTGTALSTETTFEPAIPDGGWAENNTYYAKFENINYTITFEGKEGEPEISLDSMTYFYGQTVTLPEVTNGVYILTWKVKENSGDWVKDTKVTNGLVNHYGNVTLVANWTVNVIWLDWDINILEPAEDDILWTLEDVAYGTEHSWDGRPSDRPADLQYTYTWTGWETMDISAILSTGYIVYQPTYDITINKYTVTFYDEDGATVLESKEWNYGETPCYDADPTIEGVQTPIKYEDENGKYTFAGWEPEIVTVTGNTTYKAIYTTETKVTITYVAENGGAVKLTNTDDTAWSNQTNEKVLVSTGTANGAQAKPNAGYKFVGWYLEGTKVSDDAQCVPQKSNDELYTSATYTAKFELALVDLKVTAGGEDDNQSYIFNVSGTPSDGSTFTTMSVVLNKENNFKIVIKDVPVGVYKVEEVNEWSWRETILSLINSSGQTVNYKEVLLSESREVSFDFKSVDNNYWLSGYSYGIWLKKGGGNR
ncbi:MAG: InlB B-repeat-containing protein [Lachnospiraceae bacterium]|nr:InlB B-repeat-containing protein [Lachnospiraceae bacterium]